MPVSPHIGNLGLASDVEDTTNSVFPMRTAGNMGEAAWQVALFWHLMIKWSESVDQG